MNILKDMVYPSRIPRKSRYEVDLDGYLGSIDGSERLKGGFKDRGTIMVCAYGPRQALTQALSKIGVPEECYRAFIEVGASAGSDAIKVIEEDILPRNSELTRWIAAHWARHGYSRKKYETVREAEVRIQGSLQRKFRRKRDQLVKIYERIEARIGADIVENDDHRLSCDSGPVAGQIDRNRKNPSGFGRQLELFG